MAYFSKPIFCISLLALLAACQPTRQDNLRHWLTQHHYSVAQDSTLLVVEYTVSTCLNCDYRINGFVHDLQQRHHINDSNVIVVVDYQREVEKPQIAELLRQLFQKPVQLVQKEQIARYLKQNQSAIVADTAYAKGNARYYLIR